MFVSFAAVGLNLLLNWVFTFRLGWGVNGLALSTGCVATFNFLLLYALMRRHLHGLETRRLLATLRRIAAATAALVGVCAASAHWLLADWATQRFAVKLALLLLTVVAGIGVFGISVQLMQIEESDELASAITRRFKRRKRN
jgi:peptidoglycan biosynthesis protein MviN/MurJ (putative lipid II flippase)